MLKIVSKSLCVWGTADDPVSVMDLLHNTWVIVRLAKHLSCLQAMEPILHPITIKFRNAFASRLVHR